MLDEELSGFKSKKGGVDVLGSLQDARVISIDSVSGMLVVNVGKKQKAKIGSTFKVFRGERELGEARMVEVRNNVSGALVISKVHKDIVFKVGDRLQVNLQTTR